MRRLPVLFLFCGAAHAQVIQGIPNRSITDISGDRAAAPHALQRVNASGATVTRTPAPAGITLAKQASLAGVLVDRFKESGDTDDTASFTRAVAKGVPILLGARTYAVNNFSTGAV